MPKVRKEDRNSRSSGNPLVGTVMKLSIAKLNGSAVSPCEHWILGFPSYPEGQLHVALWLSVLQLALMPQSEQELWHLRDRQIWSWRQSASCVHSGEGATVTGGL